MSKDCHTRLAHSPVRRWIGAMALITLCLVAPAWAAKIGDITRMSNQRTSVITGLGLVYGLKGTGDGGDYQPAMEMLAQMMTKFGNPTNTAELKNVKNVAIVAITATIPANGGRDGDKIDVYVTSIGAAKSLKDGRLFVTPMRIALPDHDLLVGFAQGAVTMEDPASPTVGMVKGGVVLEGDMPNGRLEGSMFRLIIDEPSASWTMASNIAKRINDSEDGQTWAWALSEKEVAVRIPPSEQQQPDGYISRIQRLPVQIVNSEARVQINEKTGTIIVTGDVEISPVVISHKGLTISTINPKPTPKQGMPVIETKNFVAIDTENPSNSKLQDLLNALDQLKVPIEDRIDIIKELHKTGKIHAKLMLE